MPTSSESIHPSARVQSVSLTVPDLAQAMDFYQEVLGLRLVEQSGEQARLGGDEAFLHLFEDPAARPVQGSTGLYHFAILVPSPMDLAVALRRIASQRWPFQGFADHLVSEAIYLQDPFGNGIEIYRDRPQAEWPYRDGKIQMATLPLNMERLMAELDPLETTWSGLPLDARLGHIHLKVASIPKSEGFYCQALGFDLIQRYGPSAGFVSAGGYHHHIGYNTWESAGGRPLPSGAAGLRSFAIRAPDLNEVEQIAARLEAHRVTFDQTGSGLEARDPSGIVVEIVAAPAGSSPDTLRQ